MGPRPDQTDLSPCSRGLGLSCPQWLEGTALRGSRKLKRRPLPKAGSEVGQSALRADKTLPTQQGTDEGGRLRPSVPGWGGQRGAHRNEIQSLGRRALGFEPTWSAWRGLARGRQAHQPLLGGSGRHGPCPRTSLSWPCKAPAENRGSVCPWRTRQTNAVTEEAGTGFPGTCVDTGRSTGGPWERD